MNPSVCICCGEPIGEPANVLSRNPNICASCSSLVDGMDDASSVSLASSTGEAGVAERPLVTPGNSYSTSRRLKRVASPSAKSV